MYQINVTPLTLPDFFRMVTGDTATLLAPDGSLVAEFDTTETWWRQDFATRVGEVRLQHLNKEEA